MERLLPLDTTEKAREYISCSKAESTKEAYRSDWNSFNAYCDSLGASSLPASTDTLMGYVVALAESRKVSTIKRHLVSIGEAHKLAGYEDPTKHTLLKRTVQGVTRELGTKQDKAHPLLAEEIAAMVDALPNTLLGLRDKVILSLGFSAALRRSELVALEVQDLHFCEEGLRVHISRSKTDQTGEGETVPVPSPKTIALCKEWIASVGITDGRLLRSFDRHGNIGDSLSDRMIDKIVKSAATLAGIDHEVSAHSLRSGFCTQGAISGMSNHQLKKVSRHKSDTILGGYVRDANLFRGVLTLF